MRAIGRRLFQGAADDRRDLLIADLARSPAARFVVEAVQPALGKVLVGARIGRRSAR